MKPAILSPPFQSDDKMQKKIFRKLLDSLQLSINALDDRAPPIETLKTILSWEHTHIHELSSAPFLTYGFPHTSLPALSELPIEFSTLRGDLLGHFKTTVAGMSTSNAEFMAMHLRDVIEQLIVFEVDAQCHCCENWGLGAYTNSKDGHVVLECKQCGHMQKMSGGPVYDVELRFSTKRELRDAGLLAQKE